MPDPHARPRQVTMAGWVTIVGSVLVIASVFAQIGSLDSLDTRRGVEEFLSEPPADGLGLEVDGVLTLIRVLAMVTGACAAATAILGWQVMQRNRTARLVLTVLAVPMFLAGLVTGGFTTSLVAAAAVVLWLQPARAWVNGDPVPERYLRPPGEQRRDERSGQHGSSGSAGPGPSAPGPDGPSSNQGSAGSAGSPSQSDDRPTGPAAYQGFGSASAGPDTRTETGAPAQWPAPGQQPGQQPAHQPGPWPAPPAPRGEMPNPLRAGLILTWVTCALVLLGLGLSVVAIALDPAAVDTEIERAIAENPSMAGEITVDQVRIAIYLALAGFAAWAVAAMTLAVIAWLGKSWAWVLLMVSAGLSAGLFLVVTVVGGIVAAIPLALAAGTLALLLRPDVRDWYRAG